MGSRSLHVFDVVPPGIEPGTRGFSVHCSTTELRYLSKASAKICRLFDVTKFFLRFLKKNFETEHFWASALGGSQKSSKFASASLL